MSNKIQFTHLAGLDFFPPTPATENVPDWYKKTESYITGKQEVIDATTTATIKKCVPVFDAMTAGYILYTQVDVHVSKQDGMPYYQWSDQGAIEFHPVIQAPNHPNQNGAPYPKWINPYAVKTPPGYSVLFCPPMHNPNGVFTILPGIVDTDEYFATVNFPFVLNDINWEGIIPAGTPMAQVIPFKRDSWKMEVTTEKEKIEEIFKLEKFLRTSFFNKYKKKFWTRKEYR